MITFLFLPTDHLLPSIAEHWAITLTSFPRTICPQVTLPYFQITLLTVLLPKAFCCLFQCPILFPCCLSHLFNLAAFSFLAAGLHTETLPSLPSWLPAPTCLRSLPCAHLLRLSSRAHSQFASNHPELFSFSSHIAPHTATCPRRAGTMAVVQILAPVKPATALLFGVVYLIHPVCAYFSGT